MSILADIIIRDRKDLERREDQILWNEMTYGRYHEPELIIKNSYNDWRYWMFSFGCYAMTVIRVPKTHQLYKKESRLNICGFYPLEFMDTRQGISADENRKMIAKYLYTYQRNTEVNELISNGDGIFIVVDHRLSSRRFGSNYLVAECKDLIDQFSILSPSQFNTEYIYDHISTGCFLTADAVCGNDI